MEQKRSIEEISKLLARWLRHRPDAIGISVNREGWVEISELLAKAGAAGYEVTYDELMRVVSDNDKKRFTLSGDGLSIRAAQGHSINVHLKFLEKFPPPVLFHGTAVESLESIFKKGLVPGSRQYVHLSTSRETALQAGIRKGQPVLITIPTHPLVREGFRFYLAENGVWLISHVPARFLIFLS